MGGIAAEERGYDAYAIMSIPEPGLRETRSIVDIPVVGYGESAMLTACMLGERIGVLMFIEGMRGVIEENVRRMGLAGRFVGPHFVGFTFNDVLQAYDQPGPLLDRFREAARGLIRQGADVIIPGEAPLNLLLARNGINRVDDVPVIDSLAATIKMAETMVDLRRATGVSPSRNGYFTAQPPRSRVKELLDLYGISRLAPPADQG
jgi:Asp/Glu/hydantoin racemase